MFYRMKIHRAMPTRWLIPLLALAGCGPTGPDGSGGAGGSASSSTTTSSSSTGSAECPTYGIAKAGESCKTDCDCSCHACGTQTTNGITIKVCTVNCQPVDGGP